jgi:hypothetical protein
MDQKDLEELAKKSHTVSRDETGNIVSLTRRITAIEAVTDKERKKIIKTVEKEETINADTQSKKPTRR